jgi:hypothetical protein
LEQFIEDIVKKSVLEKVIAAYVYLRGMSQIIIKIKFILDKA